MAAALLGHARSGALGFRQYNRCGNIVPAASHKQAYIVRPILSHMEVRFDSRGGAAINDSALKFIDHEECLC